MTTIAYDGRFVAADSLRCCDDIRHSKPARKLQFEPKSKVLFATTGYSGLMKPWADWYLKGAKPNDDTRPKLVDENSGDFIVFSLEKGAVLFSQMVPYPVELGTVPSAWGSGRKIALGVMDYAFGFDPEAYGSAVRAVQCACKRDVFSALPVSIFDFQELKFLTLAEFEAQCIQYHKSKPPAV